MTDFCYKALDEFCRQVGDTTAEHTHTAYLDNRIVELEDEVDELESDLRVKNLRIVELETKIAILEDKLDDCNRYNSELRDRCDELEQEFRGNR